MAGRGRPKGSLNKPKTYLTAMEQPNTELKQIKPIKPSERTEFYCCCCGKKYVKQQGNFSYSQSPLFKGNNSYLPICNNCIENLVEQYTELLGSQDEAIKRVCMRWDIYVSDSLLQSSRKTGAENSRMKNYIRQCNMVQNVGRTHDTYLRELQEKEIDTIQDLDDLKKKDTDVKIREKVVKFWGLGYTSEEYKYLQDQYDDWTARHECKSKAQESLFQNICLSQLAIRKAQTNGGKVKEAMDAFQSLLGSANLKPVQTNDNALADNMTMGCLLKKYEETDPIPECAPEFKDVDNIGKYISVFFLGHLCKMMNIKNKFARMYEEEMAKYTVQKPEYEGDEEATFDAVFGGGLNGKNDEEDG